MRGELFIDPLAVQPYLPCSELDVWMYTKDVLDQLLTGSTDYHALRPDVWRQSHPEAVRQYRAEERRDRAERTRLRRAQRLLANAATG
jgi:hypothetical protein